MALSQNPKIGQNTLSQPTVSQPSQVQPLQPASTRVSESQPTPVNSNRLDLRNSESQSEEVQISLR